MRESLTFAFNVELLDMQSRNAWKKKENEEANHFEFGSWMKFQGFSILPKEADGPKKKEKDPGKEDLKETNKTEKEGRNGEGLDVDLNLECPLTESFEMAENGGKDQM